MIMLFCLMDYHSWTGDERVITLMQRYFRYLKQVPDEKFLIGYWPKIRAGDQLAAIHWLYNRTGEAWLLELAERTHRHTARWDEGVIDWHNVNVAQAFRQPAQWWVQSREEKDRAQADANWRFVREKYGQVPGGMFGADENARPGFDDPRQCIETCGIVEEMLSHEILIAITGEMVWADRCEDAAFNSLPAAFTADMGGLRYLTAPNMAVSDAENHAPGIQNGGAMFLMSPHRHRCCQHNAGHGWPYLAQHLWYATPDGGLAAVFYATSAVEAKVAGGRIVRIAQDTDYPFEQEVRFKIEAIENAEGGEARFPLLLRVPGWAAGDSAVGLTINGQEAREALAAMGEDAGLVRLDRTWRVGDEVRLWLPMEVRVRRFAGNHDSAAIDRGPLTYALEIGEEYRRFDDAGAQNKELAEDDKPALNERWPAFEIIPTTAWNMALVLDGPNAHFSIHERTGRLSGDRSPWTLQTVPVAIEALVDEVPAWKIDRHGLVAPLQDSPVATSGHPRRVRFVPMGAARLRISALPVAGGPGTEATEWEVPREAVRKYKASASHTYEGDDVGAMADGLEARESGDAASDMTAERHTFWPKRGTLEWVQADFEEARQIHSVSVLWFDDTGTGLCRVPASWRVLTREGDAWMPVATSDEFGVRRGAFNTVTFEPVSTTAVRVEVQLQAEYSGGVVEMQIE
jgi:DUF1680 family protein